MISMRKGTWTQPENGDGDGGEGRGSSLFEATFARRLFFGSTLATYLTTPELTRLWETSACCRRATMPVTVARVMWDFATVLGWGGNSDKLPFVQSLSFGGANHRLVEGVLPSSLTSLTFAKYFNQQLVKGVLPSSLTQLRLGWKFNQPLVVGVFPPSLTHLTFDNDFNQQLVEGVLPASLTHLTLGEKFNQQLVGGVLPSSLTHLNFGARRYVIKQGEQVQDFIYGDGGGRRVQASLQ
jgi:hypothetical protein